jgi:hypothetical protein
VDPELACGVPVLVVVGKQAVAYIVATIVRDRLEAYSLLKGVNIDPMGDFTVPNALHLVLIFVAKDCIVAGLVIRTLEPRLSFDYSKGLTGKDREAAVAWGNEVLAG